MAIKNKIIYLFIISTIFIINFSLIFAQNNLLEKLSGRILLQVEKNGEAWYIYPKTLKKYFLNRPNDAFEIMRELGLGISNNNLEKIPIGIAKNEKLDSDGDGLDDELEKTIGTNISKVDTDGDGYDDQEEIINNYDPRGKNTRIFVNNALIEKLSGLILLQVEKNGEAWYLNPIDKRRYFLGRPDDAFTIMKELGLGISNTDFDKLSLEKIEDLDNNNDNNISQHKKNLNIEFTAQAPEGDWSFPFDEACEEASIIMGANFFGLEQGISDVNVAKDRIQKLLDFVVKEGKKIDLELEELAEVYEKYYKREADIVYDYDLNYLKREIDNNHPIIIALAGRELNNLYYTPPGPIYHVILIKGYDGRKIITHDPGTRRGADYEYDFDIIYNANHTWNNGYVSTGKKGIVVLR